MKVALLIFSLLIFSPAFLYAYSLTITEVAKPYDIIPLNDDLSQKQVFLGELTNFPIMYETFVSEPATFKTVVRQRYDAESVPLDFSLILIRENDNYRGVTEITRLKPKTEDWTVVKDSKLGMTFWESQPLEAPLEFGSYRLEISTPDNLGRFMLSVGEGTTETSYFTELANVHKTQKFFGHSFFKILTSSLVYYLLGIFFMLFVIYKTWKYRNSKQHVA